MIQIKAKIRIDKLIRTTPIIVGYKPAFEFVKDLYKSGKITFVDDDIVLVSFLNADFFGDNFEVGKTFLFGEPPNMFGWGEVIEVFNDSVTV